MKKEIKPGYGYAWVIQNTNRSWSLCHWVEPSKSRLEKRALKNFGSKPSSEAVIVAVKITPLRRKTI